ncbi:MAG: anti-sigma regulatory factor [Ruminococcaceae bacterium]|nr:anti-sigma regulatory factor [Oscillospiraceae bacterium]
MADNKITMRFDVDANNFSAAGEASTKLKRTLKQLSIAPEVIRRVAVAMYEGEINMVIHANGGVIDVEITPEYIKMILADNGPGIKDINLAMTEGYSTAADSVRELGFGAGMGLPNMKKYTDDMKITTEVGKGTTIEMLVKNSVEL